MMSDIHISHWPRRDRVRLESGQDTRETDTGGQERLADAIDHGIDRTHLQTGRPMDKRYGRTAHHTTSGRRHHSHAHDQDGEKASELVLAQCNKCNERGHRVHHDRGTESPYEDVHPHIGERVQRRALREPDHVLDVAQIVAAVPSTATAAIVKHIPTPRSGNKGH